MQNKRVLVVTGASKGIGKSIALEFIKNGWIVIGCARNKQIMNDMNKCYDYCLFNALDVSQYNDVKLWVNDIIKTYGVPDVIVNNAAILYPPNLFENKDITEYTQLTSINILGYVNVLHCFIPYLKQSNKLIKILNMTGDAGLSGMSKFVDYSTAKYAVEGLTNALSKELPNNIMICGYDPGCVTTQMLLDVDPNLTKQKALNIGLIDNDKWGELNYDFIVNKLNRKHDNGKHVFGVMAKASYIAYYHSIGFHEKKEFFINHNNSSKMISKL